MCDKIERQSGFPDAQRDDNNVTHAKGFEDTPLLSIVKHKMKKLVRLVFLGALGIYLVNAILLLFSANNSLDNSVNRRAVSSLGGREKATVPSLGGSEKATEAPSDGEERSISLPRVLALVFPQFHRDPLNDKLWGDGFTDWDNLRAAPLQNRLGFEIPRPTELGYYNLTETAPRKRQGELAREYGIDGFVYHHYWFYDETHPGPNLHKPLVEMLKDGYPNVPFFINWCGLKWVDIWSGKRTNNNMTKASSNGVLQIQNFPEPDDPAVKLHYNWLKPFFHHPNYIKVHGQPVLMLYQKKPRVMPILRRFRELATQDGFPGLYVAIGMSKTHDDLFPPGKEQGQRHNRFPPDLVNTTVAYPNPMEIMSKQTFQVPSWCGEPSPPRLQQIPGILTSFDNTPRRDFETAALWSADDPEVVVERFYKSIYAAVYYETCCIEYRLRPFLGGVDGDERLILINSMNECE